MTGWTGIDHLLTARDVADLLQVRSTRTVDDLRRSGALPARRIGRSYRFHPDTVRDYIDSVRSVAS